jgi:hypothetical protein
MKSSILFHAAIVLGAASLAMGCQKEILTNPNVAEQVVVGKQKKEVTHPFKGISTATYRAIPGLNNEGTPGMYYPGVGNGNMTVLGKTTTYVNMFVTGTPPDNLQGTPASIAPYFTTELAKLGLSNLPPEVAILFADQQGNTIWARGSGLSLGVHIVSPTKATFGGNSVILGGSGKYENATGRFMLSGWFNPQDWNEAYAEVTDGVLTYRGED